MSETEKTRDFSEVVRRKLAANPELATAVEYERGIAELETELASLRERLKAAEEERDEANRIAQDMHRCLEENGCDMAKLAAAETESTRLRDACSRQDAEICETIGKALGYPRYCDMPPINPDDPEDVARQAANEWRFTGEHVAITLVDEICRKLAAAERDNDRLREGNDAMKAEMTNAQLHNVYEARPVVLPNPVLAYKAVMARSEQLKETDLAQPEEAKDAINPKEPDHA